MRRLVNTLQARECRQRRRDSASERASSSENTGFSTERAQLFFKQPGFQFVKKAKTMTKNFAAIFASALRLASMHIPLKF